MTSIVISQPMFFPWVGLFEQIRLADIFIYYDDVQYSKGGFINRVQIKTHDGPKWLTVPLANFSLGESINNVRIHNEFDWKHKHMEHLKQEYKRAPFLESMLDLVGSVYDQDHDMLSDLAESSVNETLKFLNLSNEKKFYHSSKLGIAGTASRRVLDLVKLFSGSTYITGLGGKNYLDHNLFMRNGIRVEYMNYKCNEYTQLHCGFTPYVSILDAIANLGKEASDLICSGTSYWESVIHE